MCITYIFFLFAFSTWTCLLDFPLDNDFTVRRGDDPGPPMDCEFILYPCGYSSQQNFCFCLCFVVKYCTVNLWFITCKRYICTNLYHFSYYCLLLTLCLRHHFAVTLPTCITYLLDITIIISLFDILYINILLSRVSYSSKPWFIGNYYQYCLRPLSPFRITQNTLSPYVEGVLQLMFRYYLYSLYFSLINFLNIDRTYSIVHRIICGSIVLNNESPIYFSQHLKTWLFSFWSNHFWITQNTLPLYVEGVLRLRFRYSLYLLYLHLTNFLHNDITFSMVYGIICISVLLNMEFSTYYFQYLKIWLFSFRTNHFFITQNALSSYVEGVLQSMLGYTTYLSYLRHTSFWFTQNAKSFYFAGVLHIFHRFRNYTECIYFTMMSYLSLNYFTVFYIQYSLRIHNDRLGFVVLFYLFRSATLFLVSAYLFLLWL